MYNIIKDIINTFPVVIENDPNLDFSRNLRFRRTHIMSCIYCYTRWGGTHYDKVSKIRICYNCTNEIKDRVSKMRQNLQLTAKIIQNKNRVLEDIIIVGMNPDRVYQTQLADTLYLFKKPNLEI